MAAVAAADRRRRLGLYRDGKNSRLFIELFSVPGWDEHLRQHRERQTATDLQYHDAAAALSNPAP